MDGCEICRRIELIKKGENPYFVTELKTGYVVIGDHQLFRGYTLLLYKEHREELHELDEEIRKEFLFEMSKVAKAVWDAFGPDKLNYELLGNIESHMHWHIYPRYRTDPAWGRPAWIVPKEIREARKPMPAELEELKQLVRNALAQ